MKRLGGKMLGAKCLVSSTKWDFYEILFFTYYDSLVVFLAEFLIGT